LFSLVTCAIVCAVASWRFTSDYNTYETEKCKKCTIEHWQEYHRELKVIQNDELLLIGAKNPDAEPEENKEEE
jgi:hypothetical protein